MATGFSRVRTSVIHLFEKVDMTAFVSYWFSRIFLFSLLETKDQTCRLDDFSQFSPENLRDCLNKSVQTVTKSVYSKNPFKSSS